MAAYCNVYTPCPGGSGSNVIEDSQDSFWVGMKCIYASWELLYDLTPTKVGKVGLRLIVTGKYMAFKKLHFFYTKVAGTGSIFVGIQPHSILVCNFTLYHFKTPNFNETHHTIQLFLAFQKINTTPKRSATSRSSTKTEFSFNNHDLEKIHNDHVV